MSEAAGRAFSSILHPTDFSPSGITAFEHALKLAVANRSRFSIAHVGTDSTDGPSWTDYPQIRETLERWTLLPEGSSRHDVGDKLGVHVKKVERVSKKPLEAIVGFLEHEHADLIVLSTEGREGLPRWLHPSFSEALVSRALVSTLFVPADARGFVAHDDGHLALKRVLMPVDRRPKPEIGLDVAAGLLRSLGAEEAGIEALHVGEAKDMPTVRAPAGHKGGFETLARPGKPVDRILERAGETEADLIVMVTEGHHGFLDALRGSTTEQIVRRAPCPVLAVPAA